MQDIPECSPDRAVCCEHGTTSPKAEPFQLRREYEEEQDSEQERRDLGKYDHDRIENPVQHSVPMPCGDRPERRADHTTDDQRGYDDEESPRSRVKIISVTLVL